MTYISREEVIKIAHGSQLEMLEHEIDPFTQQIQNVLTYAARVTAIAASCQDLSSKNVNVFRCDVIVSSDAETILQRAPEREGDFFVVPVILEHN